MTRPTPGKNHKPANLGTPKLGRTHAPAQRLACDKLTPAQKALLDKAREAHGAGSK